MAQPRSRSRPVSARRWWVGPLLTSFVVAVLSLVMAAEPPDQQQVLGCQVAQALPSLAADASDGGFTFAYQSLGGVATDGRSCTVYRLRNHPGSPPTPVRWLAGDEVLVDIARLKRCSTEGDCAWFEVARYFDGDFAGGASLLSFGLNADSFRLQSDSLVAATAPDVEATSASVGTEVFGTVSLSDDSEVELDFVVKSRFERRGDVIALIYEVVSPDPVLLDGERVALVWEGPERTLAPRLPLAASARPFLVLPSGSSIAAGTTGGSASREGETVSLEIEVEAFEYEPYLLLSVVEPNRPELALLRVPLPAFVPAGR